MNPFNMDLQDNPANDCEYLSLTHERILGVRSDPEPSDDPDYLDHQAAMRQARIDSDNLPGISAAQHAERLQEVNARWNAEIKTEKAEHARQLKRQEDSLRAHYASSIYTRNI